MSNIVNSRRDPDHYHKLPVPQRDDLFYPLEQTFNKFFEEFFSNHPGVQTSRANAVKAMGNYPRMNAYVTDDEMIMHFAASGMTRDDIKLEVKEDGLLTVSGKMSEEYNTPKDARAGWRHELRQSAFERQFQLPEYVEGDPEARLKDGILTLKWKLKGKEKPKQEAKLIPIRSD